MAITLLHDATTLTLPDRLVWSDEFSWSPVEQATEWSTTGALLVDVGTKLGGRPITLEGVESEAWISRELAASLRAWAQVPGRVMTLTLRGVERSVIFDHARAAMEATPLWHLLDGEEDDSQVMRLDVLRFLEADPEDLDE